MENHTPGPWTVVTRHTPNGVVRYIKADTGHREIAVLYEDDRQEANASLVAAAPDLLTALRAVYGIWHDWTVEGNRTYDLMTAAILMAEGLKEAFSHDDHHDA